ncbi:Dephospho-CoA kinase [Methyloligella halotolerans]|uniref:Dephospho-CoA kinase n=1 Tax=Methyloligella halotolerans TaxID=1177755 RepID=A0A1E2S0L3_9HYPH|nr:dephospho-CoA kinase [Methyloligella halotolerans]ODA68036.1 Dephospho-CoA kinase [Methyloligella halotolerans]
MLVIGLTGSIGMGKTTTAACFAERGIPVCNADRIVHDLYEGEAVAEIEAAFPGVAPGGTVNRGLLAKQVSGNPGKLRELEAIIHPLVVKRELEFLREEEARGAEMVLLEIPLLYEAGAEVRVDAVVVVSAPSEAQRERVLARPGMSEEKFEALLARQMPDSEKRSRADFVVDTGGSLEDVARQVDKVIDDLRGREGAVWEKLRGRLES